MLLYDKTDNSDGIDEYTYINGNIIRVSNIVSKDLSMLKSNWIVMLNLMNYKKTKSELKFVFSFTN